MTAGAIAPQAPDCAGEQKVTLSDASCRQEPAASHAMTQAAPSPLGTTLTLRVTEARVEDVGHAIARLAPADLSRMGARTGDVLKITGGTLGVGRAELSDDAHEGMIQIDGTCRSNCSAGLQERVTVAPIETQQAVAVRLSPLWVSDRGLNFKTASELSKGAADLLPHTFATTKH